MIQSEIVFKTDGIICTSGFKTDFSALVSTDSRNFSSGEIFIALEGERFDGYEYISEMVEQGAVAIIYNHRVDRQKNVEKLAKKCLMIGVEDSLKYLQELAKLHILLWKERVGGKVLAITGSNGKTTTKEMLFELMSSVGGVTIHGTQGNFNNHIGVPLTLLGVKDEHRYIITEMGTNHPGEIQLLCDIAQPDIGIITNIGSSHLEFFHTTDQIFEEKRALYDSVIGRRGMFFINNDDMHLKKLEQGITFGIDRANCKIQLEDDGFRVSGKWPGSIKNSNIVGDFNQFNLAVSFLIATTIYGEDEKIYQAASSFQPRNNRSVLMIKDGRTLFLDAYNANPSSMESSMSSFASYCSRNGFKSEEILVILGDMNELGKYSEEAHLKTGKLVKVLGFQHAIFIGKYAEFYNKGFGFKAKTFAGIDKLDNKNVFGIFKICFIKGSRSLKLETLADMR